MVHPLSDFINELDNHPTRECESFPTYILSVHPHSSVLSNFFCQSHWVELAIYPMHCSLFHFFSFFLSLLYWSQPLVEFLKLWIQCRLIIINFLCFQVCLLIFGWLWEVWWDFNGLSLHSSSWEESKFLLLRSTINQQRWGGKTNILCSHFL